MNTSLIQRAARATLDGTMPFPAIAQLLVEAGVESYHVDYVRLHAIYTGADATSASTAIPFENLPAIPALFDLAALRAAIHDSQRNGQKFRDFTRRAMAAGVAGYIAFLGGKRVTYRGRLGDQHTEWFSGAAPAESAD